jgi:hypothetical protein
VHLRSRRTRQRCQRRVRKRRRASGGSKRGVLTNGAGGRAFENRLIARRSSTAAFGAGTADVDDRLKGNGSRRVRCGRRSAACRAGQIARSLRQAPRPTGPPPLFAPTTEKWNKTAMETACCRGICTATAFGDVAARNRNETADSGRRGAKSAAAGRRKGGALHRQRHAPHLRFLLRYNRSEILLISSRFRRRSENRLSYVDASRRGESSAPKSKSPRSRIEAHDTKNHRIDRSLAAKRQTVRGAGRDPVQKTRLVETFPTTPRSPFLPREVKILRPKNRRKIDRFRPKISKSAATMPATRASDERGNESDSQRPGMPGPERTVR